MTDLSQALEAAISAEVAKQLRTAASATKPTIRVGAEHLHPLTLLAVSSVAKLLATSTDYVYDRIKAGDLAVVELGHGRAKQRVRADVLQEFIDDRSFGRSQ